MRTSPKSHFGSKIGTNIRAARDQKKITQEKLAALCGISVIYIAFIEAGRKIPRLERLADIAEALDVKIVDLLKGV